MLGVALAAPTFFIAGFEKPATTNVLYQRREHNK